MSKRPVRRFLSSLFLRLTGWKADGVRPEPNQFVLIAAPHTTNWDFVYLLVFASYYEIQISWMGKDSLFRRPFGSLMRALGGIPVRRHKRENLVDSMARAFEDHPTLRLVVPAEGTRGHVDYWKSGFYHIARTAEVPIIMSFLDYTSKTGGFGPAFSPSGDLGRDMDSIRKFYDGRQGKYPAKFGRIRLREEEEDLLDGDGNLLATGSPPDS
jgi:1-acyl-sn-glycerol-3-phosphate acyltransferase